MRWWAVTYGAGTVFAIVLFILQPTTPGLALIPFIGMTVSSVALVRISRRWDFLSGYLLMFFAIYLFNKPVPFPPITWITMESVLLLCGAFVFGRGIALLASPTDTKADRMERSFSWVLFCFIGLLVAYYSSSAGGPGSMLGFLTRVLGINPDLAGIIVVVVRKCLHFTFYGILALASARAMRLGGVDAYRTTVFGVLWSLAHACFDELRQTGEVGRTGSGWDVLLDLAGILVFLSPQIRSAWATNRNKLASN